MILSAQNLFSDDQAIVATALSTNVIDTGTRGTPYRSTSALTGDKGKGNEVPVLVQVTEAFDNLTSLTVTIENDDDVAIGSSTVLYSETIALADLTVGKKIRIRNLPTGVSQRYLAVRYTVTGTAPTVGKVTAGIVADVQTNLTGV